MKRERERKSIPFKASHLPVPLNPADLMNENEGENLSSTMGSLCTHKKWKNPITHKLPCHYLWWESEQPHLLQRCQAYWSRRSFTAYRRKRVLDECLLNKQDGMGAINETRHTTTKARNGSNPTEKHRADDIQLCWVQLCIHIVTESLNETRHL